MRKGTSLLNLSLSFALLILINFNTLDAGVSLIQLSTLKRRSEYE